MAKDKSPRKETKKAPKNNDNNGKKNNNGGDNDKIKVKSAVPDLSTAMKQVPMKNLKSLKVKLKFHKDGKDE